MSISHLVVNRKTSTKRIMIAAVRDQELHLQSVQGIHIARYELLINKQINLN